MRPGGAAAKRTAPRATLRDYWRANHRGNIVPICTSFHPDFSVNLKAFRRHLRAIIEGGVTRDCGMILVCGAAGQHWALSLEERKAVLEAALDEARGRVPIVYGATGRHTIEAVEHCRMAEELGADGIQMSMPYYEYPTFEQTKAFYREINDCTGLGIMVYNTYSPVGANMGDYRLIEFLLGLPRIAAIKWGTQSGYQYDFVYRRFAGEIPLYDSHIHEVYGMMQGAVGFTSHIPVWWPEYGVRLWGLLTAKKYEEAQSLVSAVRVPYYQLITEAFDYTSGDGVIERVACECVGLDVGPSPKPILPCPPSLARRVRQFVKACGAPRIRS